MLQGSGRGGHAIGLPYSCLHSRCAALRSGGVLGVADGDREPELALVGEVEAIQVRV